MRIIAILSLIFSSCVVMDYGKKATPEQSQLEIIMDAPGKSKSDLYVLCNEWFVDSFGDAEAVIQFQDKEDGKIIGKYTETLLLTSFKYKVKTTISIDIKDEKIKVLFKEPQYTNIGDFQYKPMTNAKAVEAMRPKWEYTANLIQEYINKDSAEW